MEFDCVKLRFTSPVHLGEKGIGIEEVIEIAHSDTIFSGLCNAWIKLYGKKDLQDTLEFFPTEKPPDIRPPFILSSGFVYWGDILFFPKPALKPPRFDNKEIRVKYGRDIKKTSFIPKEFFESWIAGREITFEEIKNYKEIYQKSFSSYTSPRVQIDRINAKSNIYYCGQVQFAEEAGLYILLRINNKNIKAKLSSVIKFLGEEGLGGERSSGYGQFIIREWKTMTLKTPKKFNAFTTLSLFHPNKKTTLESINQSSYRMIDRKGWIFSNVIKKQVRRKSLRMFVEGSIFPKEPRGCLVDVTPKEWDREEMHAVYRYGIAFPIPVWREQNE